MNDPQPNPNSITFPDPKQMADLVKVDPKTADELVDIYAEVHPQHTTLARLADHYDIKATDIQKMLVARQISLIRLLTDFSIPSNPGDFQKLLNSQNAQLDALMKRATEQLGQLATALTQAKFLREEATRVLAAQQMELARYEKESAINPVNRTPPTDSP